MRALGRVPSRIAPPGRVCRDRARTSKAPRIPLVVTLSSSFRGSRVILRTAIHTPLGEMVAAATDLGVCLCEFADRPALPREQAWLERWSGRAFADGRNTHLGVLEEELARYFAGSLGTFAVALDTPGTPFQRAVWDQLRAIPFGETVPYDTIAHRLGKPGAQRAVGLANGANRVAVVVPCHRVIEKSGKLRGYGGGLWRKKRLLELEGAIFRADTVEPTPMLFPTYSETPFTAESQRSQS